jgi:SpoVK/Ycf46/Vps4 family AAA+-type ATPase
MPEPLTDLTRLKHYLVARHRCIRIVTSEEEEALALAREACIERGFKVWQWTATRGLADGILAGGAPVKESMHAAAALYHLSQAADPCIAVMLDLAPHLKDDVTLRAWRDLMLRFGTTGGSMIMIDHTDEVPPVVGAWSTRMELTLPREEELEAVVRDTIRRLHRDKPVQVDMTRRTLGLIVRNLRGLTKRQAEQLIADAVADDRKFEPGDLDRIVAGKRRMIASAGLLEFVETPASLSEIGGMSRLKAWLKQREAAATEEGEQYGLAPPRGVLMLGVQGAGKSLCAKAIATAWKRPLLRMDVGALYDRYVGESEKRLREALHQAEAMAPIVLWIDEIEKAFASAASQSTDGGLSKRMFATLLTWMQEHRSHVFLVATANDIEALPPELLRKGRFDEIFFVDLPSALARAQIIRIHLTKRGRDPDAFDMSRLVAASEGFSGAEIEQAIVSALHDVFAEKKELDTEAVVRAMEGSPPLSVTMAERIHALREWAEGRCVPAD